MKIIEITDWNMPELAAYTRLTEAQLRSRLEPEQGIFIAESPKVISVALAAGMQPLSLLMERRQLPLQGGEIAEKCGDIPVYTADDKELARLTGYALTRGILCAMRRPPLRKPEEVCAGASRIAVLENIVDSTNLGAIFRSAAALNLNAVLLSPACCDPLYKRAIRVSMGTVFSVPWAYLEEDRSRWPVQGMERLRAMGFKTAALALTEDSLPIDHPAPAAEPKLALLLGTEGDGLSPRTVASCDYTLKIPMGHGVDSLNVAAAGAVAFWELRRR